VTDHVAVLRRKPQGNPAYDELTRHLDDMAKRGEYLA
jgi:hypothetical protein